MGEGEGLAAGLPDVVGLPDAAGLPDALGLDDAPAEAEGAEDGEPLGVPPDGDAFGPAHAAAIRIVAPKSARSEV